MNYPPDIDLEKLRLQSLQDAQILDTANEEDFDALTRLSAAICKTPVALISLIDDKRQWFKSKVGLDVCETSRSQAFCAYTIQNPTDMFIVENTLEDARFIFNPLVTGEPHIRFYAGVPLIDSQGYALGSLCVIDYVTRHLDKHQIEALKILSKQVAAQIELRRTSRQNAVTLNRYRQILEQAADGIYIYDLQGRITGANQKFCEITGRTEDEVLHMNVRDFFVLEELEKLEAQAEELRNGKTIINEYNILRPDNTVTPVELNEKLIDENTLQGIMRDISQRRKAENELTESRQLFSLFINNSPTMIYMKDSAGRFVFANEVLEQAFNIQAIDIIGKTNESFFSDEFARRIRQTDKSVLETGNFTQTTEIVPMADGTMRHWLSHKFLIKNKADEKFIGAIAIDITERYEMELELESARDAALESANLKSAFLANISHEIRTPMNGVIGMTDLLSNTSLDETQQEYINTIRQSSESLLTVINDVLDLSKIESGKMSFNSIDFDVREVIESTAKMFVERARHKNIEINTMIEPEIPKILSGDPGRLRQILVNLIGNAIKFTETGEIKINIKIEESTENNTTLLFNVTDTGIGISSEHLDILFQPFMQVDNSNTRQFGGTGLGLALSKQLVEMMNGKISVESKLKKGSVFSFTARFMKSLSNAETHQSQTSSTEKLTLLKEKRILIADSSDVSRQSIQFYASAWNMQTAEAASGAECLNKLRAAQTTGKTFDFVLIDTNLLDFEAFALAKMIKSDANLASVEIIFVASHGHRGDADEAQRLGAAGYLSKPLRGTQLFDCLMMIIEGRSNQLNNTLITRHSLRETKVVQNTALSPTNENKLSVLVVEDNDINRRIVLAQLKRTGIDADFAVDGVDALEKIENSDYQLILMDCQMPRMDGYRATAEIRNQEKHRREDGEQVTPLVIVALTAHTLDGEREKCLTAGMSDYLSKPFSSVDLTAIIEHWKDIIFNSPDSLSNINNFFLNESAKNIDQTANIEN